ncbi:phage portal protein [Burkholderia contaminans]|nr:phage portal protein [Burkholderia contaminans]MDN8024219.1 phage portal protein [Burkholderia contaminans]
MPPSRPSRASMLAGRQNTPYDAADISGGHMQDWNPYTWSPDGEINMFRDRMVSRVRDLVRNDGWASASVTRTLDNVIGPNFSPTSQPDYAVLRAMSGNRKFDHKWAEEWGQAASANYRAWANDPGRYCDSTRFQTVPQMFRLAFRHYLADGEAIGRSHWIEERIRRGGARYATAIEVVDPDRLSNPQLQFDQQTMRGGVELDARLTAVAYWLREAHQGDYFSAAKSVTWERVPRETQFGRPLLIHYFDRERANQHRGVGFLTPVVNRLKMLIKYDSTELDAAIINAFFAAYIESPFDHELVEGALGHADKLNAYQTERSEYHKQRKTSLGDVGMTMLYPGEKLGSVSANRPSGNYDAFQSAMLRNVSAATGLAAQQISQNWAEINYSSFRAAMLEAWKTFHRRRFDFVVGFAQPVYANFLEESVEVDDYPMPSGNVPAFMEARGAYSRARWMGPGKGYVDPVKEKQGAILGLDAGMSSLEDECAEQGVDWREVADRRAIEQEYYRGRGLSLPNWNNNPANKADQPEEAQ